MKVETILVVCGNGLGSSLMMEMAIKDVAKKIGLEANVSHTDLSSAKGMQADLYACASDMTPLLEKEGKTNIMSLANIFDKVDIEAQLLKFMNK